MDDREKVGVPLRVHIHGAGKVGRTFAHGLREVGWCVSLTAARHGRPDRVDADVVVLAVRDGQLAMEAGAWVGVVASHAVVLHVAGVWTPEVLSVLRGSCRGVGQLHPLVSVASHRMSPSLEGAYALVAGDEEAVEVACRMAAALGMVPQRGDGWDRVGYHAAAWLVAGGAAALCGAARDIMSGSGIDPRSAERMLGSLLLSVGSNVSRVGLPEGLTGVVRRGDVATLRKHVEVVSRLAPGHVALYLASARAQVAMARALGDVASEVLDELECAIGAMTVARTGEV